MGVVGWWRCYGLVCGFGCYGLVYRWVVLGRFLVGVVILKLGLFYGFCVVWRDCGIWMGRLMCVDGLVCWWGGYEWLVMWDVWIGGLFVVCNWLFCVVLGWWIGWCFWVGYVWWIDCGMLGVWFVRMRCVLGVLCWVLLLGSCDLVYVFVGSLLLVKCFWFFGRVGFCWC